MIKLIIRQNVKSTVIGAMCPLCSQFVHLGSLYHQGNALEIELNKRDIVQLCNHSGNTEHQEYLDYYDLKAKFKR